MKPLLTLFLMSAVLSGCGKNQNNIAETAGKKVGETVTDFATGVGEGVDQRMTVTVELSDEFAQAGLSKTIAKSRGIKQGITVYFLAERPFSGQLIAKAVNREGQEIGRATADVQFAADDARYVNFPFDSEMDAQLVEKYVIDLRPSSDPSTANTPADALERAETVE